MKKVGIITRHAISNYGSILQSYATVKILERQGCYAEIIDYIRKEEKSENQVKTFIRNSNIWNKNIFTRMLYRLLQSPNLKRQERHFEINRQKYLKMSKNQYESFENNIPEYDIYCTGSDQVWGQIANDDYDENYFLNFAPEGQKCISYAASFGKPDISDELKQKLPEFLKKYSDILVRENTAAKILKECNIKSNIVLDPTLLLTNTEWEGLYNKKYKKNEEYILVYQLHHNKKFNKYLKKLEKKTKIKIYRISPSFYFKFLYGKFIYLPSLEEFITLFHDAKCIVTDSFHGTVFSIIFNKKMIDILPKKTGTRIESLLNLFDINNRILNDYENFNIFYEEINYKKVNKKLETERNRSIDLLKKALEG